MTDVEGLIAIAATIQNANAQEKYIFARRDLTLTNIIYLAGLYADLIKGRYMIVDVDSGRKFIPLHWADEAGRALLTKIHVREFLA